MFKIITITLAIIFSQPSISEPSAEIKKLMSTPISAFDFFLYQLHEETRCESFLLHNKTSPYFCILKTPNYNKKENTIELTFRHYKATPALLEFKSKFERALENKKLKILEKELNSLLRVLGLTKGYAKDLTEIYKIGLIDHVVKRGGLKINDKEIGNIKSRFIVILELYHEREIFIARYGLDKIIKTKKKDTSIIVI